MGLHGIADILHRVHQTLVRLLAGQVIAEDLPQFVPAARRKNRLSRVLTCPDLDMAGMPADQDKNAANSLLSCPLAQPVAEEVLTLLRSHFRYFLRLRLSAGRSLIGFDDKILFVFLMDVA